MSTGDRWLRDAVAEYRRDHPVAPKGPDSRPAPGADQQLSNLVGDLVDVVDPRPTLDEDGNLTGFDKAKPQRAYLVAPLTYPQQKEAPNA